MLDKKSKKVLNVIVQNNFNRSSEELLGLIPQKYKFSLASLDETLWYLDDQKFISCIPGGNSIYALDLTYRGKNFSEFSRIEIKKFLFQSVMVPIVVAFVTAILTILLSKLIA